MERNLFHSQDAIARIFKSNVVPDVFGELSDTPSRIGSQHSENEAPLRCLKVPPFWLSNWNHRVIYDNLGL